jgi:hypothetical protein
MTAKKGDFIYVCNSYGKFLRRLSWVGESNVEWRFGWSKLDHLIKNPDEKSRVLFIIYL